MNMKSSHSSGPYHLAEERVRKSAYNLPYVMEVR